jgi:UDP-glucose 4-epimerase
MKIPRNIIKSTLVIGGAGFIGGHLIPLLIQSGRKVTVIGRNSQPQNYLPSSAFYCSKDFTDIDSIAYLLDEHEEIIYLAYATTPNTLRSSLFVDLEQNLQPAIRLFDAIAERGSLLLLVSSGGTVYGEARTLQISEDHPMHPISSYGFTKLSIENYARLCASTSGLRYVCVRPSNAYGECQKPFLGQGFISTAMATILRGEAIKIFGEYGTVRDYIHVSDVASGIVAALNFGDQGEFYNIGSGTGLSNLDVLTAIEPIMNEIGYKLKIVHEPPRAQDVNFNVLNSALLKNKTNWVPKIRFTDGLVSTRNWLMKNVR